MNVDMEIEDNYRRLSPFSFFFDLNMCFKGGFISLCLICFYNFDSSFVWVTIYNLKDVRIRDHRKVKMYTIKVYISFLLL